MKSNSLRRCSRKTFRPRLESLETRLTPTTYTVSSLADSGPGTLRTAISSVNGDTSPDEIDFSVAGVIQLTSGVLPDITNAVKIDGTTAPGFAGAPVVELNYNDFGYGLVFDADQCTLQALCIIGNDEDGRNVSLNGSNERVIGNYIGLALDGTAQPEIGGIGIELTNSKNDLIGGSSAADHNVISGNAIGILVGQNFGQLVQNAIIMGNFIGTDPTGQSPLGNLMAMKIYSNGNTVGGSDAGAGNVIAFNSEGISISGGSGNALLGNSIHDNGTGVELNEANHNQPYPLLAFAIQTGTTTKVNGTLNAEPNTMYSVQIYVSPIQIGGQAKTLLGTVSTTSDAAGFAGFTFNAQVPPNAGAFFTSLATSPSGDTSEISPPIGLSSTANEAFVAGAYGLLLGRQADSFSVSWVNQLNAGVPAAQVLLEIQASPEYLRNQVTALYQLYLQRQPDIDGAQYWLSFLLAGGTFEEVAEGLTSSQEYFNSQGGTNQGFVTGLYTEVLNRKPSDAEVAGWESFLEAGNSRLSVSVAFLLSQEFRADLVQADYMTSLLRQADSGGLATWVNALNAGATDQQVLAEILGSPEGYLLWS